MAGEEHHILIDDHGVFHEAEPLKRCRDFLNGFVVLARIALVGDEV